MGTCGTVAAHEQAEASRLLGINLVALLEGPAGDELPFAVVAGVAALAHRLTGEDTITLALGSSESAGLPFDLDVRDNPTFAELVGRARACLDRAGAAGRRGLELRHRDHRLPFETDSTGAEDYERELRVRLDDVRDWPRREVRLSCIADSVDSGAIAQILGDLLEFLETAAADPERRVSDLPLLGPDERRLVVETWNDIRGTVMSR